MNMSDLSFSGIGSVVASSSKLVQLAYQIKAIGEQSQDLLRTLINLDKVLQSTKSLRRQRDANLEIAVKAWIDTAIRDAETAIDSVAELVETNRVEMELNAHRKHKPSSKQLSLNTKTTYFIRDSPKVAERLTKLYVASSGLWAVLVTLSNRGSESGGGNNGGNRVLARPTPKYYEADYWAHVSRKSRGAESKKDLASLKEESQAQPGAIPWFLPLPKDPEESENVSVVADEMLPLSRKVSHTTPDHEGLQVLSPLDITPPSNPRLNERPGLPTKSASEPIVNHPSEPFVSPQPSWATFMVSSLNSSLDLTLNNLDTHTAIPSQSSPLVPPKPREYEPYRGLITPTSLPYPTLTVPHTAFPGTSQSHSRNELHLSSHDHIPSPELPYPRSPSSVSSRSSNARKRASGAVWLEWATST